MTSSHPNATMVKFGFPASLVREYNNWVVLLRPAQCTLGALVLVNKSECQSFSAIGREAFQELEQVTQDIEKNLKTFRAYQKINYLMLMMVDKEVHFHVLPRYENDQEFGGVIYPDSGWPMAPDLAAGSILASGQMAPLVGELKNIWAS
ncbi:MAG: HIT family protein [Proteobacteria bacterium]|nr:HIT family protein [Pseudomonadota bacterium]